jgi:hypothetical protein
MEEAKAELIHLLAKKKKNYARYVSQVYVPHHSEKKAQELLHIKEKLKHPVKQSHKLPPGTRINYNEAKSSNLPFLSQNRSLSNHGHSTMQQTPIKRFNS